MFEMISNLLSYGAMLAFAFMVLLAMPQSKLRDVLMPIVGWVFALFCGLYVISPIDLLPEAMLGPFGLIDDAGAVVAGITAAVMAMQPRAIETQQQQVE